MVRKHLLGAVAAVAAFGMAGTAYADTIYTYTGTGGTLTIDATTSTGTFAGTNPVTTASFSFTVVGGGSFTGGASDNQELMLSNVTGTQGSYTPETLASHPSMIYMGNNSAGGYGVGDVRVWIPWGNASLQAQGTWATSDLAITGDHYTGSTTTGGTTTGGTTTGGTTTGGTTTGGTTTGGTTTGGTTTGGTTTGGTTTGGTTTGGTTTGGTSVPEPANIALFGLGALGLMFARRRQFAGKKTS